MDFFQRKIGSELDQFEAIESLANQFEDSFRSGDLAAPQEKQAANKTTNGVLVSSKPSPKPTQHQHEQLLLSPLETNNNIQRKSSPRRKSSRALTKLELYNSDRPEEAFGHIDELAINVAREDQQTFTDLVHHLTRFCLNDVEKVRAIFRWITVKNLNTMHFDSSVKPDTPLGLLRGIKNGSESYHVLFKRLCR